MRLVVAMNENGFPTSNTEINKHIHSISVNGVENNDVIGQQNEGNLIHTSSMSNGAILYSPIAIQQQNSFNGNDILRQIIANDVHHPSTMKMTNANSKDMVIKKVPHGHGAVQITYRKMIHSLPDYKKPIHILPKPTINDDSSTYINHQTYVMSSNTVNTQDLKSVKSLTQKLPISLDNCINNHALLTTPTVITPSMKQPPSIMNYTNADYSTSVNTTNIINDSYCDTHSPCSSNEIKMVSVQQSLIVNYAKSDTSVNTTNMNNLYCSTHSPSSTSGIKMISGSPKNLNIMLPKIRKPPLLPVLPLSNASSITESEKSLYSTPFNGETSFDLSHTNVQFDGNYEMEDVSEYITSSQNHTNLTNGDLGHMNDLVGMDLLSMDIDSLDAISMTTFLQNDTLLNSDLHNNFSLPVETKEKSSDNSQLNVISNIISDFSVNTNDSQVSKLPAQNIQSEISNMKPKNAFECNEPMDTAFKMCNYNYQLTEKVITEQMNSKGNLNIIDVSPETSTTLGGCKIILIGSWNAKDARYSCKFGAQVVDAELIQNGVIRCYSPKHKAGNVKLCVLCDNGVISNEVDFLIVNPTDSSEKKCIKHNGWMSITNRSLVLLLIERIAAFAEIIGIEGISNLKEISTDVKCSESEEHLVGICKKLMIENVNFEFDYKVENTMTVLHLAAALGFTKLIQLLLNWVETNPNKLIMVEACPTQYDQFSLLPIMWSSAKGHFNTTCVLHQWVESTIEEFDACGCTAIDLAKECGHEPLAEYLVRLQKKSNAYKENLVKAEGTDHLSAVLPLENQHQSFDNSEHGQTDNGCSSRTLGKTLARIQSMISDQDDVSNLHELNLDGEESLFETSPFTSRQRLQAEENNNVLNVHSPHTPSSPLTPSHSPYNRQTFQTAEFCEFFYKAKKIEKDFAELTLTDEEQEDLLKAANVIQSAYKTYKERRKRRDQEFSAAVLIQSYYRRYKQYAAFKKMQKGAVLIQNQYRAHREKSKKKTKAASVIQAYYRRYRERKNYIHDDVHLKNKIQQQADRKINRYLKQTSSRFNKEFSSTFANDDHSNKSPEPS